MPLRYSNVETHSGHGEEQCETRRSLRSESALSLKHRRDCCAPYQNPKTRHSRHQLLAPNALIASSPESTSESAWLHLNCKDAKSAFSPCISKPLGRRGLSVDGSILDMTQRRQFFGSGTGGDSTSRLSSTLLSEFAFRVLPSRLRENEFNFDETRINKIFASHWLNDRQIVLGTKCNKLLVFDVYSQQVGYIPMLKSSGNHATADPPCGIHAISVNPSSTLLATGGYSTNDIAIYSLPTFDPVAVCENGHKDWVFGIDWIDDQFFVSGSRDSNICLYRVQPDLLNPENKTQFSRSPSHSSDISSHSDRYQYSTAQSNHIWTTVPTRSSRSIDPRTPTNTLPIRPSRDSESDSDDSSDNEDLPTLEAERTRFPRAPSLDDILRLRTASTFASLRRPSDILRPRARDQDDVEEEDDDEEAEEVDVDDDDNAGDQARPTQPPSNDQDDRRIEQEHSARSGRSLSPYRPMPERFGSYTPNASRRPPATPSPPLRAFSRPVPDSWDMDEVEDEQSETTEHLSPRRRQRRSTTHPCVLPLETLVCDRAEKVRAVSYNKWHKQVGTLSLNAYFHLIDINTFRSVGDPIKLPHARENVCMNVNEDGSIFAIGSQSHVTFVDPRVPKSNATRSIACKQRGCGIRSLSFKNDLLTFGTGHGTVYFYDIRADKYLELFCGAPVLLEAGPGWLCHDDTYHDFFIGHEYPNAIYTHCYDPAGTRLFTAGGPLPAGLYGNYAALWH